MSNEVVRTAFQAAFDENATISTIDVPITVAAADGDDLTLFVLVSFTAGPMSGFSPTLSSATFPGPGGTALSVVASEGPASTGRSSYLLRLDNPNEDNDPQNIRIALSSAGGLETDGYAVAAILIKDRDENALSDYAFREAALSGGNVVSIVDASSGGTVYSLVMHDDDGSQEGPTITNASGQTTVTDSPESSHDGWMCAKLTVDEATGSPHTEAFTVSGNSLYARIVTIALGTGTAGAPPATAPTPGTITPTLDGASIVAPTLPEDADGVEYEIDDSGTWVDVEDDDPIVITGQDPNTQYDIRFRFYNTIGSGPESDPETYTTLNGVASVQIIERTETSVHVRVTTSTTGWLSVGLLPEDDTPSLSQLVAGFTSEGEPNYQYGWIGGSGGQVEITEAGTFDAEVGDWADPENGLSVPNPLDENTAYRVAAALFTTITNETTNIGDMVFADIPAFGEGAPVISRPSVFGITSSGARVRVQLGDYHSSSTGSIGSGTTEVTKATVSGTMYLSIVPDPTGDPEDWPDGDEIIAETGAVYADSKAVTTSYIPLFFGLGLGGPQEYGGLLIDFAGITGLTPGTDYVASLVQRDAGVNSTPVYFPFSTEPRFSAVVKAGFANGSPTANSGVFKLTGDDLAFAALVQFEHPEMGYDEPGGAATPTSTIPDGEGDGFYLGVHDPGTDISETAAFYPPTWYYGGEGQGLIEDGEVAFTLRTGVTGGDNIEVFAGSSGGGSADYDGIQSDSNVVLALAMRGVKGTYHQQVSDDSVWNTIQESPFTISRTVLARPGDSVLAIVLVNVGPGAGEGNGVDTGLTLTPISGVDEVLPQWSNIAVSGSSYLNTANSIHVAVCSRDATGEPDENGFVEVDVGWDLAESADDYPDNGPGYRLITFVVSGESVDPPTLTNILAYPNAVFPIHEGGPTTEARINEGEPVLIGENGGIGGLTANTTYDDPGLQLREFGGEWGEGDPVLTPPAVGTITVRITPPPQQVAGFEPEEGFIVSGDFSDGQQITIQAVSGGFGSKANAKPLYYFPMGANGNPDPTHSRNTSAITLHTSASSQEDVVPPNADTAMEFDADTGDARPFQNRILFETNELYVFLKRRYAHSRPQNLKPFRTWTGSFNSPNGYFSHCSDANIYYVEALSVETFTNGSRFHSLSWTQDVWNTDEFVYKQSSHDEVDGIFNVIRNSRLVFPASQLWKHRNNSYPGDMNSLFFDQYSGTSPNSKVYYRDIYVDDSLKRVFVSPEDTFNTSTSAGASKREVFLPTAWSDEEIVCTIRKGEHGSLVGLSLFVMTDAFTALKIGTFTDPE